MGEEKCPYLFYEARIALIAIPDKKVIRKENYRPIIVHKHTKEIYKKISKSNLATYIDNNGQVRFIS